MTTIKQIKTILDSLEIHSMAGKELKSLLYLYLNMTPQLAKETVTGHLQDAITV